MYDWETGSRNCRKCQPLSLAAVIIDPKKLEIKSGGVFSSFIKPISLDPTECEKLGIDEIQDDALKVNGLKLEDLEKAPILSDVWQSFSGFIQKFNPSGKNWDAPIRAGYNIVNYDNPIVDRVCEMYGPWDSKFGSQKLFHPIISRDLMIDVYKFTESQRINNSNSISLDSVRDWIGIDKDGAHTAIKDVLDCAFLLIKFLKLYRNFSKKVVFENSFVEENKAIAKLMEQYK